MAGQLICSAITPHSPRMGIEANAPDFIRPMIASSREFSAALQSLKPDLLIVNSTHWVTTFPWYVTCHAHHRGHCVADEAPDMIPGQPYDRPGDQEFGRALVAAIKGAGIIAGCNESPHYHWDYGSFVPLQYLDPAQKIPAVTMGTCIMSGLDECLRVGAIVRATVEKLGRRAVFLGSTAFTHLLTRTPSDWPLPHNRATDEKFIAMLCEGRIAEAKAWLPRYCSEVEAEMHGRVIATMLGTLDDGTRYRGRQYGAYAQSSASGNANVALVPA